MKKIKYVRLLAIFVMVSIILSGIISGCLGEKLISKGKYNDLEVVVELEKTTFEKGEKIFIILTTTNNGNDIITLDVKGFDIGIYSLDGDQITIIKQRRGEKTINLGDGVSLIDNFNWYQRYEDSNSVDTELESGKYYMVAYLEVDKYKDLEGERTIGPDEIKTEPLIITIK